MSAEKIRALHDAFRTTGIGGQVFITPGVDSLPANMKAIVLRRVMTFADFNTDNDPHAEHDFGSLEFAGRRTVLSRVNDRHTIS